MSLDEHTPIPAVPQANGQTIRLLIFTESFHPYTSGIARRFKTIIEHLAHTNRYLIHIVSGCKNRETAWEGNQFMNSKVTFSSYLLAIDFKDKIECALPFLLPQPGIVYALLKFKPDIIHCVEHTPAATFCGAIAKSLYIPIVWSSHTNLDFYLPLYIKPITANLSVNIYQLLRRIYLNMSDYNLTVSQDFSSLLLNNGIKSPIEIWKTGVDDKAFNPKFRSNEMRKRMFNGRDEKGRILLVSVGRLSPEKNFEFLIGLLKEFPQAFLCIVGDGPYKESLRPLFPESQTHFMGFLQGQELAAAYASADYFVYASVSETFGQVYLEAMSCSVPIVAAKGNQMKEFFQNGKHGFTWEPDNLKSAINALNMAIKNREVLVENCRENALKHSWTAAGKQIEDIYQEIKNKQESKEKFRWPVLMVPFRLAFYMTQWVLMMLLIVLFIIPFLKVSKPNDLKLMNDEVNSKKARRYKNSHYNYQKSINVYKFLTEQIDMLKAYGADLMQTVLVSSVFAFLIGVFYLHCYFFLRR